MKNLLYVPIIFISILAGVMTSSYNIILDVIVGASVFLVCAAILNENYGDDV